VPTGALAASPSNDDFANATVITSLPFYDNLDTGEATVEVDDPYCAGQAATVWYKFTAEYDAIFVADTFGSDYDTTLSVYTRSRSTLNQIACNDDYNGLQSMIQFPVSAGTTYYIMAGQFGSGGSGGSLVFNANEHIPPANDDVDNAIVIDSLPFIDSRDTTWATTAYDDPYCGYREASVWYSFTPTSSGLITLDTSSSSYYAVASVLAGPRGAWYYVNCSYSQQTEFNAIAGQTYYIMISTYAGGGGGGSLFLSVNLFSPPVNDDVDNAITIDGLPFTDIRDTYSATTSSDDPYCGYNGASVWYSFTPATDMRVELDSSASNYPTTISVYTGPRGYWGYVSCNYTDRVRFDAVAGQTYYIMIGTYATRGRNLSFSMKLAPPLLTIDVSLNNVGYVVPATGVATVTGTVTCNQSSYINGWGYVHQKVGKGLIQGYVNIYGNCDPTTPLAWSSTLTSQPIQEIGSGRAATLFTGGNASATLNVSGNVPYFNEYAYDEITSSITLRGTKSPIVSYP